MNMKTQRLIIGFLISLVTLIYVTHLAQMKLRVQDVRTRIYRQDTVSILCGCRELIAARTNLVSDWQDVHHLPRGTVVLDRKITPYAKAVPLVIRELRPDKIIICTDHVFLNMCNSPRYEVIGFRVGAPQHGTVQLIDGLWMLNE